MVVKGIPMFVSVSLDHNFNQTFLHAWPVQCHGYKY